MPANRDSHFEKTLTEPDRFDSSEFFFTRADALVVTLRGLAATSDDSFDRHEYEIRERAASALISDVKIFFADLNESAFRCIFHNGPSPIYAHNLRPLGDRRALFGSQMVGPEKWFELDYAEFHEVPQNAPQDLPGGFSDRAQLYVGSTKSELAISAHQLSLSFLNDANWELGYRPMP